MPVELISSEMSLSLRALGAGDAVLTRTAQIYLARDYDFQQWHQLPPVPSGCLLARVR